MEANFVRRIEVNVTRNDNEVCIPVLGEDIWHLRPVGYSRAEESKEVTPRCGGRHTQLDLPTGDLFSEPRAQLPAFVFVLLDVAPCAAHFAHLRVVAPARGRSTDHVT